MNDQTLVAVVLDRLSELQFVFEYKRLWLSRDSQGALRFHEAPKAPPIEWASIQTPLWIHEVQKIGRSLGMKLYQKNAM